MRNAAFGCGDGTPQSRTQRCDFDEVVEMSGLEGRVLTVIGERQQLPGFGPEPRVRSEMLNRSDRHDRRSAGPPAGTESRKPGEVATTRGRVIHTAGKAETERRRNPPGCCPIRVADRTIGAEHEQGRNLTPSTSQQATIRTEPLPGQAPELIGGTVGPGARIAQENEPGFQIADRTTIRQIPSDQPVGGPGTGRSASDGVVVLAAFAAERERKQNPPTVATRSETLAVEAQRPDRRRLGRCVNGVATADELVQTEREHLPDTTRFGNGGSGEKVKANGALAGRFAQTCENCQIRRRAPLPYDRSWNRPYQTAFRICLNPERGLQPRRQRVVNELVVGRWRMAAFYRFRQDSIRGSVGTCTAVGDPLQRFADHRRRLDGRAEQ